MQRINTDRNFVDSDSSALVVSYDRLEEESLHFVLLKIWDNYLLVVLVVHVSPRLIQSNPIDDQTTPVLEWCGSFDKRNASKDEHGRSNQ